MSTSNASFPICRGSRETHQERGRDDRESGPAAAACARAGMREQWLDNDRPELAEEVWLSRAMNAMIGCSQIGGK